MWIILVTTRRNTNAQKARAIALIRGAILSGNMTTDVTIHFGVDHVDLTSALPAITGARMWIDGMTVLPRINASVMTSGDVFTINGDSVTLSNLVIYNTPAGMAEIFVDGGHDARIAYNYLGVLPEATNCYAMSRQGGNGVYIDTTAGSAGLYNGAAYIYDNVIGCHTADGIRVYGSKYVVIGLKPDEITVGLNWIGLNSFYNPLPNQQNGIKVLSVGGNYPMTTTISTNQISINMWSGIELEESSNNIIYGNTIGNDGTMEMGNHHHGVSVIGSHSSHNTIQGNGIAGNYQSGVSLDEAYHNFIEANHIGVDYGGSTAIPNGEHGVQIIGSTAVSNTVGGEDEEKRNIISGNSYSGVYISDGAQDNEIKGNWIGLNITGTAAIPNGHAGVAIVYADNNYIGSYSGQYNYISGNTREGVYLEGSNGTIVATRNVIGLARYGDPLGNGEQGILINGSSDSTIRADTIAYNKKAGLAVITDFGSATGNNFWPVQVFGNGGLPIDLGNDGFTLNGTQSLPGPNDWMQYPVITGMAGRVISGIACSNCYVLFFVARGNPAAPGGGGTYVGGTPADGPGNWSKDLDTLTGGTSLTRASITMVACDSSNNCSEMSPRPVVYLPLLRR